MHFACLSFKQYIFLQASGMMKSLTSFDFSSESWKKYKRSFQPVSGKSHKYKWIFMVTFWVGRKGQMRGAEMYAWILIQFADLSFKQYALDKTQMKSLTSFDFSSEPWKTMTAAFGRSAVKCIRVTEYSGLLFVGRKGQSKCGRV